MNANQPQELTLSRKLLLRSIGPKSDSQRLGSSSRTRRAIFAEEIHRHLRTLDLAPGFEH